MNEPLYYVIFYLDHSLPEGPDFVPVEFFNRQEDAQTRLTELGNELLYSVIQVTQRALIRHFVGDRFWPLIQWHTQKVSAPKPTIGRTVIYVDEYEVDHPAVITAVTGKDRVNLKVLCDGPDTLWLTNVRLDEAGAKRTWCWPKRS